MSGTKRMFMKKIISTISILLIIALLAVALIACDDNNDGDKSNNNGDDSFVAVDYVSNLKLDMNSSTAKFKNVKVKNYIDGDTTHFYVDSSVIPGGVLKARYLAINTPESTGKIEAYGHKASNFTKEKLKNAVSIVLESDGDSWEADSTGSRYLTWVWYKTSADSDYRNLNVEILQNGLAIASNTMNNRYGTTAFAALQQAKAQKLNVFSGVADPDLYAGSAVPVTLKELRCNLASYEGIKVAVDGIVARNSGSNAIYLESEEVDSETGLYYGIYCYYGFSNDALRVVKNGYKVRIVGTVQYWETGGTYQISGLQFDNGFHPDEPDNSIRLDDKIYSPANQSINVNDFVNKTKLTLEFEKDDSIEEVEVEYPELMMNTTVQLDGLYVSSVYTTVSEDSSSIGAMTFTCTVQGKTISVRTAVLVDENNKIITEDAYKGKTINIKGVVDNYNGTYQVKVLMASDITIVE